MTFPPPGIYVFLLLLVIPAAIWDLRSRRIPNWLTLSGVVVGVLLNWFLYEADGLIAALKGLGIAFGVYFVLYLLRGMGAGDVKLMAAIGASVGPTNWQNWLGILVLTSIAGAILGLLLVFLKQKGQQTVRNLYLMLMSFRQGRAPYQDHPSLDVQSSEALRLPHGVAIALGTIGFLVAGWIWAPK